MSPPRFGGPDWVYNLQTVPKSTNAGHIIVIAATFSAVSLFFVVVRLATRWKMFNAIGLDDIAATASMLLGIGYSSVSIYQTRYGLGLSRTDFPLVNVVSFTRVQFAGGPIYCLAILGFKVSILASYLRFAGFNQIYRRVLMAAICLVTVNQLIYTCLLSFACRPLAKQWDQSLPGTCVNQLATYFGLGGSSLGLDILIIILPFPILRRLQLDIRKKIWLGGMFAIGFFLTAVQAVRVRTIAKLADLTDSEQIIEWSIVEINVGVMIACVPSYAPLLKYFGNKMSSSIHSRSRSKSRKKSGISGTQSIGFKGSNLKNSSGGITSKSHGFDDDEIELWTHRQGMNEYVHVWSDAGKGPQGLRITAQDTVPQDGPDQRDATRQSAAHLRENDIVVVREVRLS